MTAMLQLSLYCPRMAIYRLSDKLAQTALEPMSLTLSDGTLVEDVTIPQTYVDRVRPLEWLVRQCVGQDENQRFTVTLLPQTCTLDLAKLGFYAMPLSGCPAVYMDQDGRIWRGTVDWPESEVQWWMTPLEAVPVTATGTLTLQG